MEIRLIALLSQAQGLAHQIHVVAEIAHLRSRNLCQALVDGNLVPDVVDHRAESQHRILVEFPGPDVVRQVRARIANQCSRVDVTIDHL